MRRSTWMAFLDLGDGCILIVHESDVAGEGRYTAYRRQAKASIGHDQFEVVSRPTLTKKYPEAVADWDAQTKVAVHERTEP